VPEASAPAESGTSGGCCASPMLCDVIASRSRDRPPFVPIPQRSRATARRSGGTLFNGAQAAPVTAICWRGGCGGGIRDPAEQREGDVCGKDVVGRARRRMFNAGSDGASPAVAFRSNGEAALRPHQQET